MSERAISIERPGLQTLVVDRGRYGLRHEGVGWCGAIDMRNYTLANELAGNLMPGFATLEIVLGDAIVIFEGEAKFALTGADCGAQLDGVPITNWKTHEARVGSRLLLGRPRNWIRTYIAIYGGIDVPIVLGSRTTDLLASMGGFEGRALRAGDRMPIGAVPPFKVPHPTTCEAPQIDLTLRTIAGPLAERLWHRTWTVGHDSNRMGYRLRGDAQPHEHRAMPSHAVFPGFIQLPPSGEPIVLMSDCQTTGGYPLAGVVVEEDLWMLGQAQIGAEIRFTEHRL